MPKLWCSTLTEYQPLSDMLTLELECIFRPVFGCCTLQKLVEICFLCKNLKRKKKQGNCRKIKPKNVCLSFNLNNGQGFYSKKHIFRGKNIFLYAKACAILQFCVMTRVWVHTQKHIFCLILHQESWKRRFWLAFGVSITQMLVEIYTEQGLFELGVH